jgi:hypothetical protein
VSAMGGVRPLMVVEIDPATNAYLGLRSGLPGVQVDAFILQGPPQALDEDIVRVPTRFNRSVQAKDVNWLP